MIATGLVMVALGVALPMAGLDDADKYASVLGAFTGVAGLALSAYGVVLARRAPAEAPAQEGPSPPPEPDSGAGRVRNSVSGTVHGPVLQADTFTGPITIGTPRPCPPSDEAAGEREGPAR
ncbi:hypothetical protein ABZU32_11325 [Sphaerisporangium sp. NPDC005288]|uniref:hypothetical protein n=1 Tax=Sphaerisporangium sp. NPDC005288 TaxID=3155114 RepID=UPI0033AF5C8F